MSAEPAVQQCTSSSPQARGDEASKGQDGGERGEDGVVVAAHETRCASRGGSTGRLGSCSFQSLPGQEVALP